MTGPKRFIALALLGFCLTIGSFADEAAQVVFALRLANNTSSVSALLAAGLVGGILAGPIAPQIIGQLSALRTITIIYIGQAVLIVLASLANSFLFYIAVAVALGCTGSLLWSAVMIAVSSFMTSDKEIDRINRIIQTVRNLGYVCGPALGGILYAASDGSLGLLFIAAFVLLASPVTIAAFRALGIQGEAADTSVKRERKGLDVPGLYRTEGVLRAVAPLLLTIVLTSALNVLLIILVRQNLKFSSEAYGIIISALSVGLIVGPLTIGPIIGRLGDAAGASLSAAIIGLGILSLSQTGLLPAILVLVFIIGAANGVQNALMGSFMMKAITKADRVRQMPAYVVSLQTSVFVGFVCAGFVANQDVTLALTVVGLATALVGLAGIAFNIKNRPTVVPEGG